MRTLGLQQSLTCDGVLQSARSIAAAFKPSIPGNGFNTVAIGAEEVAAARVAAAKRSHELLRFVDHRADQLLLASGESGRWFVDPPSVGGNGHGHGRSGGRGGSRANASPSSASDSDEDLEYSDSEDMTEEERDNRSGSRRARDAEPRESLRARREFFARRPPPNAFVEELNSIAWLPVHARATNSLMPWKVGILA